MRRLLSPIGFVLVGLSFLLPFVSLRLADNAAGQVAITWHGAELTVGGDGRIHLAEPLPDPRTGELRMQDVSEELAPVARQLAKGGLFLPGQPAVIGTVLLVLLGVLSVVPAGVRTRRVLATVAGLAGAAALTLGEWLAARRIGHAYPTHPPVLWAYGFWLVLALLLALGAVNAVLLYRSQPATRYPTSGP